MATGEDLKPLTGPNRSASSSSNSSRNDCDEAHWMHPNNWEISSHSKPSKKQRNKEKSYLREAIAANASEGFSTNSSFQNYTRAKCNTASWLKDEKCRKKTRDIEVNSTSSADDKIKKKTRESENNTALWLMDVSDDKIRKKIRDSEEVFSDSDLPHGGMNLPVCHAVEVPEYPDESQRPPSRSIENESIKTRSPSPDNSELDEQVEFEQQKKLENIILEIQEKKKLLEIILQEWISWNEHSHLVMATREDLKPLTGPNRRSSSSSNSSQNDCDEAHWMHPNNWVFSDSDLPHGGMNLPVCHAVEVPEYPDESQRPPSRSIENESIKTRSPSPDNSELDEQVEFEQKKKLENIILEIQEKKKLLEIILQEWISWNEHSHLVMATREDLKPLTGPNRRSSSSSNSSQNDCDEAHWMHPNNWVFSDSDLPHGGMTLPVCHAVEVPEHPDESQRPPSRSIENESIKTRSPSPDNSELDEHVEFEQKKLNKILELQEKKKANERLLQELIYLRDYTVMATREDLKPLTGPNRRSSSSSNSSQNDCDEAHWMHPNNWEISSHSKPSKKQRNKEKSYLREAIAANASEGFSTNSSFQNYTRAKCNTASWLKDEKCRKKTRDIEVNSTSSADDKIKKKTRESENNTASWLMDVSDDRIRKKIRDTEEVFSDSDLPHGGMNLPVCHAVEVPEHPDESQRPPSRSIENESIKTRSPSPDNSELDEHVEFEQKKLNKILELQEKKKANEILLQELIYLRDYTVMATGEDLKPLTGPNRSASSSSNSSRNDCDEAHWMHPNNWEISSHSKPSKKQRNKEKSYLQEAIAANASEGFSTNSSFQNYTRAKCNTASWLKDEKCRKKTRDIEVNSTSSADDKIKKKTRESENNTASWLMDVSDDRIRKKIRDSEEVFSDSDLPHGGMNLPVCHSVEVPEHPDESQRPPSRSIENESIKAIKDDCKKNEEIRDEFNKIKEAMKQVTQGEREHKYLLQHMASESGFVSNGISTSASKASNCKANVSSRDSIEGSTYFSDEEHSNKCNHLLDKMKQSEERLMCLKQQESLLYQMQKKKKKVESKLASFQAIVNIDPHEENDQESVRISQDQILLSPEDQAHSSSSWHFNAKGIGEQRQWTDKSFQSPSSDKESPSGKVKDIQDIKQLQMSLERIKKQVLLMQQNTDIKNITRSPSPDNSELDERVARVEFERKKLKNKLLELQEKKKVNERLLQELIYLREHTVNAVTVEDEVNLAPRRNSQRVLLKDKQKTDSNKAVPNSNYHKLQTTLKYLESLMKSMSSENNIQNSSLNKESTRAVSSMDLRSETNLIDPSAKYHELHTTLKYLEDIMSLDSPENSSNEALGNESARIPAPRIELRNIRSGSHMKRDNVRKNINSGFPARRHYEAEGRANEDADLPTAPLNSSLMAKKSRGNIGSESENLRKLQEVQKRILIFNDLITSIQEHNETGKPISLDHQRLIASLDSESNNEPWLDISSSDCEEFDCIPTVPERKQSENSTTVKEICVEGTKSSIQPPDIQEEVNASPPVPYNMELPSLEKDYAFLQNEVNRLVLLEEEKELVSNKKKDFSTLKRQINQLIQRTIDGRNEDTVRSSGEGGYVLNRNADSVSTTTDRRQHAPPVQFGHQDNLLLTRQNIATMESQNQRCSRNLHNRSCGSKKDNINNLSGKMGKLSIQNAVNGPFSQDIGAPKDNLDSISMFSSDLNQSHCGETERKTILDILKRNRKKQKVYDINQDNQIFSNSSIDSETVESSQAANTTAGATWGGSSTHEIFQEENDEPPRRLGAQLDAGEIHSTRGDAYRPTPRASKSSKKGPLRGDTSGSTNDLPRSPQHIDSTLGYQQQISVFIIQLQKHIDQLNALCQEKLNDVLQTSMNFHPNNSPNLLHTAPSIQTVPENIQPYNQQLLLCLSQCYHTLYLQQLEIQHLHRCLRHNIDSEVLHQASNLNPHGSNDEFIFRPWCLPTSNPFTPSDMYSNAQVSPKASPANYLPFPFKACPPHNATAAGIRPVRAVIHPANHGNASAHETLNNQVPPHTRANNFLDNFRSYSRQNMLSTSNNIKRNENIGLPVAPQIRQVHPMVSNEGLLPGPHSRTYSSPLESDFNRSFINPERQLPTPRFQDVINCSKKPNANSSTSAHSRYPAMHKKGVFTTSDVRNIRSEQHNGLEDEPASTPLANSSINLVQLYPIQDESKIGIFPTVCSTSVAESVVKTSDASSHAQGEFDYNSDFLHSLYQEAKSLKSHIKRQQALDMIRDLAISENDDSEPETHIKISNDLPTSPGEVIPSGDPDLVIEHFPEDLRINTTDMTDLEKSSHCLSESSIPWTNQNLPTAAISPLSKQTAPRPTSTGAVRKKTKMQSSSFRDSASSTQACSNTLESETTWEELHAQTLQSLRDSAHEFAETAVENILLDLQTALPFGQMREDSSMSFWCSINAFIINRIRAHMNVPLPHKSLALMRHRLDQIVPRYIGKRICDCETEFLKCISQFLYDSIACFMSTGRFTSSSSFDTFSKMSFSSKSSAKPENLSVKIPVDIDKAHDMSINTTSDDIFSPHCQPVFQQNIALFASETENDVDANNHLFIGVMSDAKIGSEWSPEAETEPEVEAGTEADLAEADQSPGQGNLSSTSLSSAEPGATVNNCGPVVNEEEASGSVDEATEVLYSSNLLPDGCADLQAIALDDVPTKLCSTEEEPQKLEEEPIHLDDSQSDDSQNNELLSESNNCESEITSTK